MCYNQCSWFSFNPLAGTDKCTKPKGKRCPDDEPISNCCGAEMGEYLDVLICPKCKEHCGIEGED